MPAKRWNVDFQCLGSISTHQYTYFLWKKSHNFVQIGCFLWHFLKIHPIYGNWSLLTLDNKLTHWYSKIWKKAHQKAGTYHVNVRPHTVAHCYSHCRTLIMSSHVYKLIHYMWLNILKGTSCWKTGFWVMGMQSQNISKYSLKVDFEISHTLESPILNL